MTRPPADLPGLQAVLDGEVVLPGSPSYEVVRKPAMTQFHDVRPAAVVLCASPGDVVETLAFARRSGLPVVPRSGGHCFAGRSSSEGIVIDVSPMNGVSLDGVSLDGGMATIGAGARLGPLYDALDVAGRTIPAGCGPTVGIAGLTLGGGLGLLGRKYGLTCDRLRAATVVLSDGWVVDCDERQHEDLFWALRGAGGGQFGIVTSLVFDTVAAPMATTFHLTWPGTAAATVIAAWQEWAPDAVDELDANLKVTAPAGRPVEVHLFGTMLEDEAPDLLAWVGVEPATVEQAYLPYREAKASLVGLGDEPEPDGPRYASSKSEFFRQSLPEEAIADLLGGLEDAGESRSLNFTPIGGAYNRVPSDATAFAHRGERFVLEHEAAGPTPSRVWVRQSWDRAHPWGSGHVYPNFPDPDLTDWAEAYHGGNHERLLRIKAAYDPRGVFRFGH